jgi:hypothetical protein
LQEDGDRFHILQNLREAVQAQLSRAVGSSVRALLPASNGDEEREAAIACSPRDKHGDAEHRCLTSGDHKNRKCAAVSRGFVAWGPGFEPRLTESES